MKALPIILALVLWFGASYGQKTTDLFMHKELRQAYENGYRSFDGTPGPNYFINRIDYDIKADFDPETRLLSGSETITFTNNSPDSLDYLVFNLYQDIYKKGNSRDWDMGPHDIHDGVNIKKLKINGKEIPLERPHYRNYFSLMTVRLPDVLASGEQLKAEVDWEFTVAEKTSIRQGMYGEGNFFIAYWYPKIAVYDDLVGWDTHGHTGRTEFYNDFGDYKVEITVPAEYTVWSGGVLQNAKDILTKKYYKRYREAHESEKVIKIISADDREKRTNIQKDAESHTWKFDFENTPDFSFALSNTYLWDGVKASNGERDIFVQSAYKSESENFHEVAEITKNIVEYFSTELPAIPFPYPQATAFNGGGGMEFPGMVNDTEVGTRDGTIYLTSHEFGHSYFPFAAGFDEQKFAWMDEGLISYFPRYTVNEFSHEDDPGYLQALVQQYAKGAGNFNDMPMIYPSENTGRFGYRFHAYTRPGAAFYVLEQEIGKDLFFEALREFYKRWEGKHPKGFDLFFTFNEVAGQDLAWFWKAWFFDAGYPDIALNIPENGKLAVIKKGLLPVPVRLQITFADGTSDELFVKAENWKDGKTKLSIDLPAGDIVEIKTDTNHIPDSYPEDNIWKKN